MHQQVVAIDTGVLLWGLSVATISVTEVQRTVSLLPIRPCALQSLGCEDTRGAQTHSQTILAHAHRIMLRFALLLGLVKVRR